MPRKPTAHEWIERIRHQRANSQDTAAKIASDLKGMETPDNPAPGEKTVRKYMNEFDELDEYEQAQYRIVVWPDTYERAGQDLPWQAARFVRELEAHIQMEFPSERLSLRRARWAYRLWLAFPELSMPQLAHASGRIALLESRGEREGMRQVFHHEIPLALATPKREQRQPAVSEETYQRGHAIAEGREPLPGGVYGDDDDEQTS